MLSVGLIPYWFLFKWISKRGTIQDATFIEADPGKSKKAFAGSAMLKKSNPPESRTYNRSNRHN
jgi:hypothetical protein